MRARRAAAGVATVLLTLIATAGPASAHGLGGRSDLPLPVWMFLYGAAGALIVSFAALAAFWPQPRLEGGIGGVVMLPPAAERTGTKALLPRVLFVMGRVVGLVLFAVVVVAAVAGDRDTDANLAPVFVYVVFWVGMQLLNGLVGDVWHVIDPFDTLAAIGQWLRRRSPSRGAAEPAVRTYRFGYWPAAVLLFGFVWLELVYPEQDRAAPRVLAVAVIGYTVVVLGAAARSGRGWLRTGEAFGAWFGILSHMAPLYRDDEGRLRLRPPLVGLAILRPAPGLEAVVLVVLGSTAFDGIARSRFWADLVADLDGW